MIIKASQVLEYIDLTSTLKVVDMEGKDAFPADYDRILELVCAGHVCGRVTRGKLKYLELIVPISETITRRVIETSASVNARTNLGAYRQHLETQSCWALCMSSV